MSINAETDRSLSEKVLRAIAEHTGQLVNDYEYGLVLVLEPETWYANDGYCEIETIADNAEDAVTEYVEEGSWDEGTTMWITASGYRKGVDLNGDWVKVDLEEHTVTIEPEEPACSDDEDGHSWEAPWEIVGGIEENPGVWSKGGGVTIQEVCLKCGCGRLTDTWAQNPETGEQGLTSVTYETNWA